MRRCLNEMVVGGIETTIPLFQDLLHEPDIHRRRLPHPLAGTVDGKAQG